MKKQNSRAWLTDHEQDILSEMNYEVYGHGGIPYHSLACCPRGISRNSVVKMVELGYLKGIGAQGYTDPETGELVAYDYTAVVKHHDPAEDREASFLNYFEDHYPDAEVLYTRHLSIIKMLIVANNNGRLLVVSLIGIPNPEHDLLMPFSHMWGQVEKDASF